ncbi:MAG TPA: hypothetical protein GXZ49_03780 [Bacteroidetes bacterium]|jgi:hypothetical protein|nr:hypothetical protein [Bacteroidota bacterium]
MLNSLTPETRVKPLMKFFLNGNDVFYIEGLESVFGESTKAIRLELNRFEEIDLLVLFREGNKRDIHNIILFKTGIDKV